MTSFEEGTIHHILHCRERAVQGIRALAHSYEETLQAYLVDNNLQPQAWRLWNALKTGMERPQAQSSRGLESSRLRTQRHTRARMRSLGLLDYPEQAAAEYALGFLPTRLRLDEVETVAKPQILHTIVNDENHLQSKSQSLAHRGISNQDLLSESFAHLKAAQIEAIVQGSATSFSPPGKRSAEEATDGKRGQELWTKQVQPIEDNVYQQGKQIRGLEGDIQTNDTEIARCGEGNATQLSTWMDGNYDATKASRRTGRKQRKKAGDEHCILAKTVGCRVTEQGQQLQENVDQEGEEVRGIKGDIQTNEAEIARCGEGNATQLSTWINGNGDATKARRTGRKQRNKAGDEASVMVKTVGCRVTRQMRKREQGNLMGNYSLQDMVRDCPSSERPLELENAITDTNINCSTNVGAQDGTVSVKENSLRSQFRKRKGDVSEDVFESPVNAPSSRQTSKLKKSQIDTGIQPLTMKESEVKLNGFRSHICEMVTVPAAGRVTRSRAKKFESAAGAHLARDGHEVCSLEMPKNKKAGIFILEGQTAEGKTTCNCSHQQQRTFGENLDHDEVVIWKESIGGSNRLPPDTDALKITSEMFHHTREMVALHDAAAVTKLGPDWREKENTLPVESLTDQNKPDVCEEECPIISSQVEKEATQTSICRIQDKKLEGEMPEAVATVIDKGFVVAPLSFSRHTSSEGGEYAQDQGIQEKQAQVTSWEPELLHRGSLSVVKVKKPPTVLPSQEKACQCRASLNMSNQDKMHKVTVHAAAERSKSSVYSFEDSLSNGKPEIGGHFCKDSTELGCMICNDICTGSCKNLSKPSEGCRLGGNNSNDTSLLNSLPDVGPSSNGFLGDFQEENLSNFRESSRLEDHIGHTDERLGLTSTVIAQESSLLKCDPFTLDECAATMTSPNVNDDSKRDNGDEKIDSVNLKKPSATESNHLSAPVSFLSLHEEDCTNLSPFIKARKSVVENTLQAYAGEDMLDAILGVDKVNFNLCSSEKGRLEVPLLSGSQIKPVSVQSGQVKRNCESTLGLLVTEASVTLELIGSDEHAKDTAQSAMEFKSRLSVPPLCNNSAAVSARDSDAGTSTNDLDGSGRVVSVSNIIHALCSVKVENEETRREDPTSSKDGKDVSCHSSLGEHSSAPQEERVSSVQKKTAWPDCVDLQMQEDGECPASLLLVTPTAKLSSQEVYSDGRPKHVTKCDGSFPPEGTQLMQGEGSEAEELDFLRMAQFNQSISQGRVNSSRRKRMRSPRMDLELAREDVKKLEPLSDQSKWNDSLQPSWAHHGNSPGQAEQCFPFELSHVSFSLSRLQGMEQLSTGMSWTSFQEGSGTNAKELQYCRFNIDYGKKLSFEGYIGEQGECTDDEEASMCFPGSASLSVKKQGRTRPSTPAVCSLYENIIRPVEQNSPKNFDVSCFRIEEEIDSEGKENKHPRGRKAALSLNTESRSNTKVLRESIRVNQVVPTIENDQRTHNPVASMSSFRHLVQQKPAALPYPVEMREIKVKVLEAVEVAKPKGEKREQEHKMQKVELGKDKILREKAKEENRMAWEHDESAKLAAACSAKSESEYSLKSKTIKGSSWMTMSTDCASNAENPVKKGVFSKVQRAAELKLKLDQQKAKEQEVQRRKEEKWRKKEVEIATRKRKREEAEKKEREQKRKRAEEMQRLRKEQEELELEQKRKALEERERGKKAQAEEAKRQRRIEKKEAEHRRKNIIEAKAVFLAEKGEKGAERRRKEVSSRIKGLEEQQNAQINKLSGMPDDLVMSSATHWEAQFKGCAGERPLTCQMTGESEIVARIFPALVAQNGYQLSVVQNSTLSTARTIQEVDNSKLFAYHTQVSTSHTPRIGERPTLDEGLQSYEISPYRSSSDEEDEDDNDRSRKPIPLWARKENLMPQLIRQQYKDPDEIFLNDKTCSLEEIFETARSKKRRDLSRRSGSGNWLDDRVTWKEELDYKRSMGYIN